VPARTSIRQHALQLRLERGVRVLQLRQVRLHSAAAGRVVAGARGGEQDRGDC
jgi:hypothetical protein